MNDAAGQTVPITDLREGDVVDFTDQVNRYQDLADPVEINGRETQIGDYTRAQVQAAFLHLGHDKVIVVTDQITPYLPVSERVVRLSQAERSGPPTDLPLQG
ncbi:hypothetical protein MUG78_17315 [Gordonia alkaliphila]|uniref:hypothetical protein n=1 Tax=Gordonia alkaliphila TaxID=1053547 RepID=UPI001FF53D0B|nr:hypothetical protein [Gordonia alkaliphila]MCK0441161.1 hypothetical protein [Gordonia alkaliphila]